MISLLKIDTEGSECEILETGDADLWSRIHRVAVEFHDDILERSKDNAIAILERRGFSIAAVDTDPPFCERTGIVRAVRAPQSA